MGWFEEQIKERKVLDEEQFFEAAEELQASVNRKKVGYGQDKSARIKGALDEILIFYNKKPRDIPVSIKDLNEKIEYVCHPYGIMHRNVKLEDGWYKDAVGAMFGSTESGEPVALLPGKFGGYYYTDPVTGEQVKINKKTQNNLNIEAICFYRPFPLKELTTKDLYEYMLKCISPISIIRIVIAILASTVLGLFTPRITKLLFSTIIDEQNTTLLFALAVLFVSITVAGLLMTCIKNLLISRISTEINISVEAATMARVYSLPAKFFKDYGAGELAKRCAYIDSFCTSIVNAIFSIGLTSIFSLIYIKQIFDYAKSLVVPAILITLITLLSTVIATIFNMANLRDEMAHNAKESGMTFALISGIQKLKLSGSEKRAFSRWLKLCAEGIRLVYDPVLYLLLFEAISTFISLGGTVAMYFFAVKGGVSVSDYYAFTTAYGMISVAFTALAGATASMGNIKPIWNMIKPMLQAIPEIGDNRKAVTRLNGNIELSNVCFRYKDDTPNIVDNLSIKIKSGQYVAIVGKTGCGKSTLVRLLLGFESPQKGAIYYDGQDLATLDLRSVRRNIGCVTQNGKLFQGDIYSNIVISAPWLTLDEAWEAAEVSGFADDIRNMPMGMHTIITEGSGGISGGQKQRLMIARAVAPKPKVLIFDEATSALDNITQKKVSQALDSLNCTRIVIAHRLSTIRQCDRIIVLEGGKIIEDGTYDQLITQNGFFAELVERQRLDVKN